MRVQGLQQELSQEVNYERKAQQGMQEKLALELQARAQAMEHEKNMVQQGLLRERGALATQQQHLEAEAQRMNNITNQLQEQTRDREQRHHQRQEQDDAGQEQLR